MSECEGVELAVNKTHSGPYRVEFENALGEKLVMYRDQFTPGLFHLCTYRGDLFSFDRDDAAEIIDAIYELIAEVMYE